MPNILSESALKTIKLTYTGNIGELAVMIRNDLAVGRIVERQKGWSAFSVRGFVGKFNCQAAAVAALTLKITL